MADESVSATQRWVYARADTDEPAWDRIVEEAVSAWRTDGAAEDGLALVLALAVLVRP